MQTTFPLNARVRTINRPMIAAMWFFTLLSWIAPHMFGFGMLICCLFNLAANILALILVFSPVRANLLHGGIRLLLQLVTAVLVIVMLCLHHLTITQLLSALGTSNR
jgi:hypothetical protein